MPIQERPCPVIPLTAGPGMHFFGYYDKSPWDVTGRYVLALRVGFMDRPPTPQDVAVIGMVDLEGQGAWQPLAETSAWYWQQGTMLQWLPSAPDRQVIFNVRTPERFGATVLDVETGSSRCLPRPVYAVAPDGRYAVTLNYARVHRTRPGYGYAGVADPWADQPAPAEDGIRSVELANTMLYSSLMGKPIDLPLDSAAYEKKLKELIATSTFVKETEEQVETDLSQSFNS